MSRAWRAASDCRPLVPLRRMSGASLCAVRVFPSQVLASNLSHWTKPRSRERTDADSRYPDFGFRLPCRRFALAFGGLCAPPLVRRRCRFGRLSRGRGYFALVPSGRGGGNGDPHCRPLGIGRNQIALAPRWCRAGIRRSRLHRGLPCCAWYRRRLRRRWLERSDSIGSCRRHHWWRGVGLHPATPRPILTK
jgi:hypothetical protein